MTTTKADRKEQTKSEALRLINTNGLPEILTPTLRKAYWTGYADGYSAAEHIHTHPYATSQEADVGLNDREWEQGLGYEPDLTKPSRRRSNR